MLDVPSMSRAVGIDFGTTNSAVAVADDGGAVTLLSLPAPGGGVTSTWRTILYFESGEDPGQVLINAGAAAIERYAQSGGQGRLIQSIKSHLASELFSGTHAAGRHYRIEELIATFLRKLRGAVAVDLGRRAVVGRPVRHWGAQTAENETRALDRSRPRWRWPASTTSLSNTSRSRRPAAHAGRSRSRTSEPSSHRLSMRMRSC